MTRYVLVTGASNGIGLAIAARFTAGGDTVYLTGRDPGRLKQAASQLAGQAGAAAGPHPLPCDATDPAQVGALASQLGPRLDVLVNNAGGNTDFASPPDDDSGADDDGDLDQLLAGWRANLEANLLSAVLTTHAVAGQLAPGGSVISIGSIGAERGAGSYGAAKAALSAWNAGLSAELGPRGITANVISAGLIDGTGFFRGRLTPQRHDALVAATHDKRPGQPGDVAQAAYFLASPGARHITGQVIHLNGGAFTTR
ncbi:MAG TPA: SDR family oxidoreductase [Streptosporangiaceae bacterium]|jgi:3-oxoacyl-[acyl-carrier protein] reductase